MNNAGKPEYTIEQLTSKGFIKRNMKCLCGSGKKIKICCKDLFKFRAKATQDKCDFDVAYKNFNDNQIKSGFKKLTKQQFLEHLEDKENEDNS